MEKAIIINQSKHFKYWSKEYSRVYFGNEFCAQLLPSEEDTATIAEIIKKEKLRFTLLTPPAGSQELKAIKKLFGYFIKKQQMMDEVVVNDYGVFNFLKRRFRHRIILGRILSRFAFLQPNSFLYRQGVRRLEFDDLDEIKKPVAGIGVSFYYPYMLTFATRYCPAAGIGINKLKNYGIKNCSRECLKIGALTVDNHIFIKRQILIGNAMFMENNPDLAALQKTLVGKNIDRLIFQPPLKTH